MPAAAPRADAPSTVSSVSDRKLAANRANAAKSTGPRTEAGKRAASLNATTHGLTAQTAVLPGEDAAELEALAREMFEAHRPARGIERVLVERIIAIEWKLRRAAGVEPALAAARERKERERFELDQRKLDRFGLGVAPPASLTPAELLAEQLGDADGPFLRLAAYEARLTSQLLSTCRALERAQKARADHDEPADEEDGTGGEASHVPAQNEATDEARCVQNEATEATPEPRKDDRDGAASVQNEPMASAPEPVPGCGKED